MSNNPYLTGKRTNRKAARLSLNLASWSVNLAYNVSRLKRPGVYTLRLVVCDDGQRELITEDGKIQTLGKGPI